MDPEKRKVLEMALSQIEKSFGKGAIMRMGESARIAIETIPTGSLSLDVALGGGVPKGRIIEIFGPESAGKTTLALHILSEMQKTGGQAAFIDAEHALDPDYARRIGVDVDNLLISQPDSGEQALEIVQTLVASNAVDIIVVDSVAALTPRAEIEGEMGDAQMGAQARLMSQAMRKLTALIGKSRTTVIFLNQLRMKIGVMFGNPETTPGGNALKFYSSVRLEIRAAGKLEEGTGDDKRFIGIRSRVKIVKNKVAPPFKIAEFDILYATGISFTGDVLDLATKYEIISKSGAFYSYNNERLGQGRENAKDYLEQNPKMLQELDLKVRALMKQNLQPDAPVAALEAVEQD
ncbi:MAG: recombinase RecA [Candidatus Peregrinibacteria bacterium]|nr:recombinase RecA [Candidatus Peregrinibacteria bacterium]